MPKNSSIPYGKQFIDNADIKSVNRALRNDLITTGSTVQEFEKSVKKYLNSRFVLSCNSGTSALNLAMSAMDVGPGDNIIMPTINFTAAANVAKALGAKIYLADVNENSGQMTKKKIEDCIKKNKLNKIKLLVTMYLGGIPHNVKDYYDLKKKYKFLILEDACHALGSQYYISKKLHKVGSCHHCDVSTFSFHPLKSITTGEGGLISTNNKRIFEKAKLSRSHGMIKSNIKFNHRYNIIFSGHNYRLSDINCALGLSQLKKINLFTKKRNTISRNYSNMLSNIPGIMLNWKEEEKKYSSCHLFIVLIDFSFFKTTRDKLMKYLYKKGITTQVHYIPLFKHSNFKNLNVNKYNGTNNYYSKCLSLPIYYSLNLNDQKYIVKNIKKYLKII